jgi:hypothetical protein
MHYSIGNYAIGLVRYILPFEKMPRELQNCLWKLELHN